MSETKKIRIVLLVIIGVVLLLPLAVFVKSSKAEKILKSIDAVFENDEVNLIYIGSANCGYCEQFNPIINEASESYNFPIYYVDTTELLESQNNKLLNKLDIVPKDFGTPYIAVVEKGKKIAEHTGFVEKDELLNFLQENKIIGEDVEIERTDEFLNKIDFKGYLEAIDSDDNTIVVYASSTCPACIYAKPILNEVAKENDVVINYLELDKIDSDDYEEFYNTLDELKIDTEDFGTPTTIIVKNKKIIDVEVGAQNKEDAITFYKKHNLIK